MIVFTLDLFCMRFRNAIQAEVDILEHVSLLLVSYSTWHVKPKESLTGSGLGVLIASRIFRSTLKAP